VDQAIEIILSTAPGERPMRPEFGCGVHDFVFDTIDAATVGRLETECARRSTAGSRASWSRTSTSTSRA
jgi:phage baseplate assembly protein W